MATPTSEDTPDPTRVSPSRAMTTGALSVRNIVTRSERRFDVTTLPPDMLRVYRSLESKYGEEYGLLFVFTMQTAIELHRAWHMTLLTSKILQRVKDRFGLRMTWNLGVIRLKFRVEDGGFELHRKVPYDYDSEFQDLYKKISSALCEGHITVHEALILQQETKAGLHTAKSGIFLRDFPGRLVLYPALAATCAVIFFGGSWVDAGVAAICGVATGLLEYFLCYIGGEAKVLIDIFVGIITGVIGGLFFESNLSGGPGGGFCLSAIFLGTLYWFFYGTAFVIGLLEIIAGELETGVTRFIAVSVKTFVLCLGASFGMLMTIKAPADAWETSTNEFCGTQGSGIDLSSVWWRIPLYLACSAAALGQYRMPITNYWRGLSVQLVAYEVQYQVSQYFVNRSESEKDNVDVMASNICGAAAGVVIACILSWLVDCMNKTYYGQLLQRGKHRDETPSKVDDVLYGYKALTVRCAYGLGLGRKAETDKLAFEKKLKQQTDELRDPNHPRSEIVLEPEEENLLVDTIVCAESINIWAMLMPAVYQLVPGSMIARLWFNAIFPPQPVFKETQIPGTNITIETYDEKNTEINNVFSNLMVISCSLALGLIIGFAVVQTYLRVMAAFAFWESDEKKDERQQQRSELGGMYAMAKDELTDDPDENQIENSLALTTVKKENGFHEEEVPQETASKEEGI